MQAKDTEIRGTRFVITGLKTGGQYKFRVIAFNVAGNGEPGEVPEVLEVNDRTSECVQIGQVNPVSLMKDVMLTMLTYQLVLRLTWMPQLKRGWWSMLAV